MAENKRASPLAARVYKLEQAVFHGPEAAPPPSIDYFGKYISETTKIADLVVPSAADQQAKNDLAYKDQMLADVRKQRDMLQAEAEALRKFVPKAGTVVETHDAKEARAYFLAIAAMLGAALGALAGGLLL